MNYQSALANNKYFKLLKYMVLGGGERENMMIKKARATS